MATGPLPISCKRRASGDEMFVRSVQINEGLRRSPDFREFNFPCGDFGVCHEKERERILLFHDWTDV